MVGLVVGMIPVYKYIIYVYYLVFLTLLIFINIY